MLAAITSNHFLSGSSSHVVRAVILMLQILDMPCSLKVRYRVIQCPLRFIAFCLNICMAMVNNGLVELDLDLLHGRTRCGQNISTSKTIRSLGKEHLIPLRSSPQML